MVSETDWSEEKNRSNVEKHGIAFEDAAAIFDGPTLEKEDTRIDYGEQRIIAIGSIGISEVTVVYTWRGQRRRLISARRASSGERKAYRQAFSELDRSG